LRNQKIKMNPIFTKKLLALITFSLVTTTLSAINFKTDLKKETNNSATAFWQQPHVPDYAAELQKYKPSTKELDKQQANDFIANAKQNVSFLENKGQMMDTEGKPVPFVLFKAEAPGMNVYITEKGLTYVFVKLEEDEEEEKEELKRDKDLMLPSKHDEKLKAEMAWINVNLKGASIKRENIIKEEPSAEHFNYFYGHCPEGIYDVYQYKKLTIKNVYPNIDWVFYNSQKGGMKYDFIVHPGANPNNIKLIYESETPLDLDKNGNLQLKTKLGTLTENAPYSYLKETNTEVKSSFKTTQLNKHQVEVAFNINQNTYTQNSTLVIDPQLVWGTFYGGNDSEGPLAIETDSTGNLFVSGYTVSANFPLLNAGTFFQGTYGGGYDAFILKFTNNGNLLWATYYGGSVGEAGYSICIDSNGNVFVAGWTSSPNFPVQNAGTFFQGTSGGGIWDAFILKFDNSGNRLWATYYGGSGKENAYTICTDPNGNVFVTGETNSPSFPLQNAGTFFQGTFGGGSNDAFILKFTNNGNRLWATYYGGSGSDIGNSICTDTNGNLFVTGETASTNFPLQNAGTFFQGTSGGGSDAFILKFDNSGNRLWATYYGGSGTDYGISICIDSNGNVFVIGETASTNFPLQNAGTFFQGTYGGGLTDAFILKFDNTGNRLWASYFGGSGFEASGTYDNIAIDNCNNIYFCFVTDNVSFPHLINYSNCSYFDNSFGGVRDIIIARFTNTGSLAWCTYFGGDGADNRSSIATDLNNKIFLTDMPMTGFNSATYPNTNTGGGAYFDSTFNGGFDDAYILKFSPAPLSYTSSSVQASGCGACDGSASFSISCGETPYSYVWSNGTSVLNTTVTTNSLSNLCAGVHNVTVTAGCTQTLVETYTISSPGIVAQANVLPGNAICAGQSFTLTTDAAPSYTWVGPNNFSSALQSPMLTNLQLNTSGVYTLNVTSPNGCVNSATLNLTVIPNPQAVILTNAVSACPPLCASYSFVPTADVSSYTWLLPSSNIIANTPTIQTCYSSPGTYTVQLEVKGTNGCASKGSYSLQVYPKPIADFVFNPTNPTLNDDDVVTFKDATGYGAPTQWAWYFLTETKNTITKFGNETTYKYSEAGTYPISLVVTNKFGCIDTVVKSIVVADDYGLFIPNAFTPNSDGVNDTFEPKGHGIKSYTLVIFDRWGEQVYTTNHFEKGWDGYYKGVLSKSDVYTWKINCVDIKNKSHELIGSFTLLK
jgi:gliding motility-associated-like protein